MQFSSRRLERRFLGTERRRHRILTEGGEERREEGNPEARLGIEH